MTRFKTFPFSTHCIQVQGKTVQFNARTLVPSECPNVVKFCTDAIVALRRMLECNVYSSTIGICANLDAMTGRSYYTGLLCRKWLELHPFNTTNVWLHGEQSVGYPLGREEYNSPHKWDNPKRYQLVQWMLDFFIAFRKQVIREVRGSNHHA